MVVGAFPVVGVVAAAADILSALGAKSCAHQGVLMALSKLGGNQLGTAPPWSMNLANIERSFTKDLEICESSGLPAVNHAAIEPSNIRRASQWLSDQASQASIASATSPRRSFSSVARFAVGAGAQPGRHVCEEVTMPPLAGVACVRLCQRTQ
jgi:hypothetical protein